ncbi:NLI interacting factor family phosphatase [Toxoplasma gondii RUB]|uniref:NLI interacting factor family phosphatase n=1 Tax=Toxoplasma gondii RUB TaxID=935652 RepID=A0A086M9X0_TOXGO|nr:NLI interacting factor family phosphatase [Toxoplasma gondii RUB]
MWLEKALYTWSRPDEAPFEFRRCEGRYRSFWEVPDCQPPTEATYEAVEALVETRLVECQAPRLRELTDSTEEARLDARPGEAANHRTAESLPAPAARLHELATLREGKEQAVDSLQEAQEEKAEEANEEESEETARSWDAFWEEAFEEANESASEKAEKAESNGDAQLEFRESEGDRHGQDEGGGANAAKKLAERKA